ncbi:MAG: ATP-binding cassette domain-containing protein [Methanobacteriota archaeon]|nr:MAG: ATP-binding cassette domain-containing protein [Euryarchaeota archaeon]
MNDVVAAQDLSKTYGEVLGLNGFSATFGPGITGLVGPNGAGKSTLFKILIGQLRSDKGDVRLLAPPSGRAVGGGRADEGRARPGARRLDEGEGPAHADVQSRHAAAGEARAGARP